MSVFRSVAESRNQRQVRLQVPLVNIIRLSRQEVVSSEEDHNDELYTLSLDFVERSGAGPLKKEETKKISFSAETLETRDKWMKR